MPSALFLASHSVLCHSAPAGGHHGLLADRYPCSPAAPKIYVYESTNTNATYIFNAMRANQSAAEAYCQDQGGHLASFASAGDQSEVEGYFMDQVETWGRCSLHAQSCDVYDNSHRTDAHLTDTSALPMQGYMLPAYHRAYWIGLSAVTRTVWSWLEPSVPPLNTLGAYVNWYTTGERPEPNNMRPPEDCAVSNLTAAIGGVGGWADQNCGVEFPFICMLIRGWHVRLSLTVPRCDELQGRLH
jgi:hypothetical protein